MDLKTNKIYIDEENTQIIWGLVTVVSIGIATYVLLNAFMAASWQWAGYKQLLSMALFIIGFYGIIRLSSPLYHFILEVEDETLLIEIWKESEQPIDVKKVQLDSIEELRIAPHTPRSPNEALFDFTTSYYLLYKTKENDNFNRLISLEGESFTLKVDDIKKIIRFLKIHHNTIRVPDKQKLFLVA